MAKPLAGRRAFEAMGRSARSRNLSLNHDRAIRIHWPEWARRAWATGWIKQCPKYQPTATEKENHG